MPSPKKSSKSPARSRARGRSSSASRTKTPARSRSRSSARKPKSAVPEPAELTDTKVVVKKLPSRPSRSTSKSPSRVVSKEGTMTKRTVISTVYSSVSSASLLPSSSTQEQASITPGRTSSRIASLIEKEKEESLRLREKIKSEMLSQISTPPPKEDSKLKSDERQQRYDFVGSLIAFLLIIILPIILYYANFACSPDKLSKVLKFSKRQMASLFEIEAMLIILGWFFFQAFLAVVPVGRVVNGQPLKSGGYLKYRCNGLFAMAVSLLLLGVAVYCQFPVTRIIDKYDKLMTASIIFSFALSICLYVKSRFVSDKKLAPGGNTGNIIYDFFIGRELNPRVGMLDLKFFCELRPGMIGLVILEWIMVIKVYQETSTFPPNLILITAFQTLYVADAFWFEDAFLTTLEITHDGFGFVLAFGSLAWLPFFYSIQARFIFENSFTLPWYCLAPIALIHFVGFSIYRLSNLEKYRFRNDPKHPAVSGLESIPTKTNKRLLVSGWWGICRKPIYLGDIIMAFSWSLLTGFGQIVTYFYPIYLLIFLIHRERRDSQKCREKYGASWDLYCERIKYRIFPYIY